jgi:hypothetical protein
MSYELKNKKLTAPNSIQTPNSGYYLERREACKKPEPKAGIMRDFHTRDNGIVKPVSSDAWTATIRSSMDVSDRTK